MEAGFYKEDLFKKCADFHGHICPGLSIGYRAALYAADLLGLTFSEDEDVVCVSENDACGVDAIQVVLGCSVGKGNLLFNMRGKQAFSFYDRKNNKSIRLVLKDIFTVGNSREAKIDFLHKEDAKDLFSVEETTFQLPERARIFKSYPCEKCNEMTAESFIRLEDGKKLCLDCYKPYSRFN